MSLFTMTTELTGMLTRMPYNYAQTCVQRATLDAYRQSIWSFLTFEGNWTSPNWVTAGTAFVTQGSNTIQFDPVTATPAVNAIGSQPSPVTKRQFRIGVGTIYNIWSYVVPAGAVNTSSSGNTVTYVSGTQFTAGSAWVGFQITIGGTPFTIAAVASPTSLTLTTNPGTHSGLAFSMGGVAVLDRSYQEPSAAASAYSILQCYYVAPVPDFKAWASIRDMVNYNDMYFHQARAWVDIRDPQRTWYQIPTHVVYYQNDQNPNSTTYGWPMFELWGAPTYVLTYQLYGYRKGFVLVNGVPTPIAASSLASGQAVPMVNMTDDLPTALGEDCVIAKARKYAYEWAEANPAPGVKRAPNYITLKRDADEDFKRLFKDYRRDDRATVDAFHTKFRVSRPFPNYEGSYNAISGIANPGVPGGA